MAKKTETEKKSAPTPKPESVTPANSESISKVRLPSFIKNRWFLIGLMVVVLVVAGWLAYSALNKEDKSDDGGELTYAEQLETIKPIEGASQETINVATLSRAWAHFNEANYETALERLDSIKDPSSDLKISMDELYGEIYRAMGQSERAVEYGRAALAGQEATLLDNVDDYPDLHFSLARLYENAGDTAKAKQHYQAFVDEFDAPPDEVNEELVEILNIAKEKANSL